MGLNLTFVDLPASSLLTRAAVEGPLLLVWLGLGLMLAISIPSILAL